MSNRHLIGKQLFEMEVNTSENAYVIQQKVSAILKNKVNVELGKVLDRFVGEEEMLCIDHLELDIGWIDSENLQAMVGKVLNALEQTLQETMKLSSNRSGLKSHEVNSLTAQEKSRERPPELFQRKEENSYSYFSERHKDQSKKKESLQQAYETLHMYYFKLWIKFLITGVLPSYAIPPEKAMIRYVIEALVVENAAVVQLESALKKHPVALERLILQHPITDLVSLLEIYSGFSHDKLVRLLKDYKSDHLKDKKKQKKVTSRQWEVNIWKFLLSAVIIDGKKCDSQTLVAELKTDQFEEKEASLPQIPEETAQFFNNAGVVLAHPFLKGFFEKLALIKEGDFKNQKARSKGVLLLNYLATGEETAPEYELFLPKFICQVPANMPIDHCLKISTKEKKRSRCLIRSNY